MFETLKGLMNTANATVPRIDRKEAEALLARGNAVIVDVRDAPELEVTGIIPGALHNPRGMIELQADPSSQHFNAALDRSKTIILHCASGARSAAAGKQLKEMGFENVYNLGGLRDWIASGGPVEKLSDKGM